MNRTSVTIASVALLVAACQGGAPTPSVPAPAGGTASPAATSSSAAAASPVPTGTASPPPVLAGHILYQQTGPDEVEHYFTVDPDGTNEKALFTRQGCSCAYWSADGSHVFTVDATGLGTWSLAKMKPDGSDSVVVNPPIKTLSLFVGPLSADGRWMAFWGDDETDPSAKGLYLASPDLADVKHVTPLKEGWKAIQPFGVAPDGSRIVFMAETGPNDFMTHGGDLYVVNSDGSGLRQLNPAGTKTGDIGTPPISMSPDGSQAAFGLDDAVWVVDLAGGEARKITKGTGFVWAVQWSPTGDWISYVQFHGKTSVVALIRPDGTEDHEISERSETDEANSPVWSPDSKYLLVQRDSDSTDDGPMDLWVMDLDGAYVGQVTHKPSTNYGVRSWAPKPGS